jgi:hypothetical protein
MIALVTALGFFVLGSLTPGFPTDEFLPVSAVLLVASPTFVVALTVVCLWHAIALNFAMLVLTIFRSLYLIIHRSAISLLNAASNPTTSPFQYFAALVALCAMTFKVIDELTK